MKTRHPVIAAAAVLKILVAINQNNILAGVGIISAAPAGKKRQYKEQLVRLLDTNNRKNKENLLHLYNVWNICYNFNKKTSHQGKIGAGKGWNLFIYFKQSSREQSPMPPKRVSSP